MVDTIIVIIAQVVVAIVIYAAAFNIGYMKSTRDFARKVLDLDRDRK